MTIPLGDFSIVGLCANAQRIVFGHLPLMKQYGLNIVILGCMDTSCNCKHKKSRRYSRRLANQLFCLFVILFLQLEKSKSFFIQSYTLFVRYSMNIELQIFHHLRISLRL